MGFWSRIRGVWSRHDERLAESELMKESTGVDLHDAVEKAAIAEGLGHGSFANEATRAVAGEAEAERDAEAEDDQAAE